MEGGWGRHGMEMNRGQQKQGVQTLGAGQRDRQGEGVEEGAGGQNRRGGGK